MQNFYELQNLIEKSLEEGMSDKVVGAGGRKPDDYISSIGKNIDVAGSDGYVGSRVRTNAGLDDTQGRKIDKQVQQANWDQAVADNPDLDFYAKAADAQRQDALADREAEAGVGIQGLAGRRGGRAGDVMRTDQNDVKMQLQNMKTPQGEDGALLWDVFVGNKKNWDKAIPLGRLYKMMLQDHGWEKGKTLQAIKLVSGLAPDKMRIFKSGVGGPNMIKVVDPFSLGAAGSEPEARDADVEDANLANVGGQFSPDLGPKATAAAPQSLEKHDDDWSDVEQRANQALLNQGREVPNPKEIEGIINDLKSMVSDRPEKAAEIKGFIKELEMMVPQREWLEIYESMCMNGI